MEYLELFGPFIEYVKKKKMKHNFHICLLVIFAFFTSCKKSDKTVDDPHQGTITVMADESFKSVTEALTERYMALNPKTKINLVIKKEDLAFLDLLENKARVIVMSRDLSEKEKKGYSDKVDLPLQPAKFAADAVVFVVPKTSSKESISVDEIKSELHADSKKIIFDGTNASNLNYVAQKFNTTPDKIKYSIINGNKNIVQQLGNFPDKIGAISLNTISRPYDKDSEELRNSVKILKVTDKGNIYEPTIENIKDMTYPFTRVLYFLTNEGYYGLGNGFIRFSCQQLGQIVVEKEGLQPYNIFKREVQMR